MSHRIHLDCIRLPALLAGVVGGMFAALLAMGDDRPDAAVAAPPAVVTVPTEAAPTGSPPAATTQAVGEFAAEPAAGPLTPVPEAPAADSGFEVIAIGVDHPPTAPAAQPTLKELLAQWERLRRAYVPYHVRYRETIAPQSIREAKLLTKLGYPEGRVLVDDVESMYRDERSWRRPLAKLIDGKPVTPPTIVPLKEAAFMDVPDALSGIFQEFYLDDCTLSFDGPLPVMTARGEFPGEESKITLMPVARWWLPIRIKSVVDGTKHDDELKDLIAVEWEVKHLKSFGTDRPPQVVDGVTRSTYRDGEERTTITSSFEIITSKYGKDVGTAPFDEAPPAAAKDVAAALPQAAPSGNPLAAMPAVALDSQPTPPPIGAVPQPALTVEVDDRTRQATPVAETIANLQEAGLTAFVDGSDRVGKPVSLMAEIHAKPDLPADEILTLIAQLRRLGISRILFQPPAANRDNQVIVICPHDIAWRRVRAFTEELEMQQTFKFDVRIAADGSPVTPVSSGPTPAAAEATPAPQASGETAPAVKAAAIGAEIYLDSKTPAEHVTGLIQRLQKLGIDRFSLKTDAGEQNRVVLYGPADVSAALFKSIQAELAREPAFPVEVVTGETSEAPAVGSTTIPTGTGRGVDVRQHAPVDPSAPPPLRVVDQPKIAPPQKNQGLTNLLAGLEEAGTVKLETPILPNAPPLLVLELGLLKGTDDPRVVGLLERLRALGIPALQVHVGLAPPGLSPAMLTAVIVNSERYAEQPVMKLWQMLKDDGNLVVLCRYQNTRPDGSSGIVYEERPQFIVDDAEPFPGEGAQHVPAPNPTPEAGPPTPKSPTLDPIFSPSPLVAIVPDEDAAIIDFLKPLEGSLVRVVLRSHETFRRPISIAISGPPLSDPAALTELLRKLQDLHIADLGIELETYPRVNREQESIAVVYADEVFRKSPDMDLLTNILIAESWLKIRFGSRDHFGMTRSFASNLDQGSPNTITPMAIDPIGTIPGTSTPAVDSDTKSDAVGTVSLNRFVVRLPAGRADHVAIAVGDFIRESEKIPVVLTANQGDQSVIIQCDLNSLPITLKRIRQYVEYHHPLPPGAQYPWPNVAEVIADSRSAKFTAPIPGAQPGTFGGGGGIRGGSGEFQGASVGIPQSAMPGKRYIQSAAGIVCFSDDDSKVFGYSEQHPHWALQRLEPLPGSRPEAVAGNSVIAVYHGHLCFAYSPLLGTWDTLTLSAGESAIPTVGSDSVNVTSPTQGDYLYKSAWGKWFSADEIRAGKVAEHLAARQSVKDSSGQPILKTFPLRHVEAAEAAKVLRSLYDKADDLSIAADERTNQLIIRAPERLLQEIEALLRRFDEKPPERAVRVVPIPPGGATVPFEPPAQTSAGPSDPKGPAPAAIDIRERGTGLEKTFSIDVGTVTEPVDKLRRQAVDADRKTHELAAQLRGPLPDPGVGARLQEELRVAVQRAFEARQTLQQGEIADLARRLQGLQRTHELRSRVSDRIVARRVEELLDPSLWWDPPVDSASVPRSAPSVTDDGTTLRSEWPVPFTYTRQPDARPAEVNALQAQLSVAIATLESKRRELEAVQPPAGTPVPDSLQRRGLENEVRQAELEVVRLLKLAEANSKAHGFQRLPDRVVPLDSKRTPIERGARGQEPEFTDEVNFLLWGSLGIACSNPPEAHSGVFSPSFYDLRVTHVRPGSPAAVADIRVSDIIGMPNEITPKQLLEQWTAAWEKRELAVQIRAGNRVLPRVIRWPENSVDPGVSLAWMLESVQGQSIIGYEQGVSLDVAAQATNEAGDSFGTWNLIRDGVATQLLMKMNVRTQAIDLAAVNDRGEIGARYTGIWELKDGDLRVAFAGQGETDRPTDFEGKTGTVQTWKPRPYPSSESENERGDHSTIDVKTPVPTTSGVSRATVRQPGLGTPNRPDEVAVVWQAIGVKVRIARPVAVSGQAHNGGLEVTELRPNSPVQRAGLRIGDIIIGLGRWEILTLNNLLFAWQGIRNEPSTEMLIVRGQQILSTTIRWDSPAEQPTPPPSAPAGSSVGLDPILERLDRTAASISTLSLTTDYVKRQQFLLPFDSPIEMKLTTQATISSDGNSRVDTSGQQLNIEPDGKSIRTYDGRWVGVFQNGVARNLTYYEGNLSSASIDTVLSWHGLDPREFTTHFQRKPITEILRTRGAEIGERTEWDGRPVTVVETTPRGDGEERRRYRFWIDTDRGIVVRRAIAVRYKEGQPWQEYSRIEGRNHREISPGIWLPMQVKYESLEVTPELAPEKVSWSYAGTNRDWKVNVPLLEDAFELEFPDGVRVDDHRPKPTEVPSAALPLPPVPPSVPLPEPTAADAKS